LGDPESGKSTRSPWRDWLTRITGDSPATVPAVPERRDSERRAQDAEIAKLEGDAGAKHMIGEHSDLVCEVGMPGEAAVTDIDTPEALAAWRARST